MIKAFLITLLLTLPIFLFAQEPAKPDTLLKKSDTAIKDTIPKTQQATVSQEQPKQQKVRKDTRPLKDRIDIDFNTSFWMNTSQVFGEAMVLVSYRFPKILSIGAGPTYIFNYQRNADMNLNGLGGKLFVRAQLLKFFYLWTEYQGISNQYLVPNDPPATGYHKDNSYTDSWFFGAGVTFGHVNMSVLYDVLYNKNESPYYSPVIYRVGFSF